MAEAAIIASVLERLRSLFARGPGIEETAPPRPALTPEEETAAREVQSGVEEEKVVPTSD